MKKLLSYTLIMLVLFASSCSDDNDVGMVNPDSTDQMTPDPTDPTDPDPADPNSETITILTNNSQKSWRIEKATLVNPTNSSSLDISEALNIKDDVFVFSTTKVDNPDLQEVNGSISWRGREGVNWEANSSTELYKDFYEKEIVVGFQVQQDNTAIFKAFEGLFDFTITNENTIIGKIKVSDTAELEIILTPLLDTDLPVIPASISFTELTTLEFAPMGTGGLLGLKGSNQTNSLYISKRGPRDSNPDGCRPSLEEVAVYNVASQAFESKLFCQYSSFTTKEIEIIDGKLVILSSDSNNVYNLDLSSDPLVNEHDERLTRYGSANYGNDIFVTGSRFDPESTNKPLDQLFKFDTESGAFNAFATLPKIKYWADLEIVDNKLYLFGGLDDAFETLNGTDDLLIYDFSTTQWQTLKMPKTLNDTFTARYYNLIFVGGNTGIDTNGDGNTDKNESFLGVFNTNDNTLTEISVEINTSEIESFRQLTILNDKLYVITSSASVSGNIFKLHEADLN
ncbi:kelch repeat-containing protein [Aquimarina sp. 2304DJ70-9]|uniref:kelch repeat-containing protein n=1 Tax=Aquimarina penaris TaxID=3231044 RepID=UPI0034628666